MADTKLATQDPTRLFADWLDEARLNEPSDAEAMALATADPATGMPSVRIVLLKDFDATGFVFYTNLGSAKGQDLAANPQASICFHWKSLQRQVRAQGRIEPVSDHEADVYFNSRPRESRIGAWASHQSTAMKTRFDLEKNVARCALRFGLGEIPRPPHWSGFRLHPSQIEFWQAKPFRLHQRQLFTRGADGAWAQSLLFP